VSGLVVAAVRAVKTVRHAATLRPACRFG
jgi:hypothetical protein